MALKLMPSRGEHEPTRAHVRTGTGARKSESTVRGVDASWSLLQRSRGNHYVQRLLRRQLQEQEGQANLAEVAAGVESTIERARGGGQALDRVIQAQMGSAFGADFSGVRVHADAEAHGLNRAVGAVAFTTGNDIFFSHGAYQPESSSGRELLAHELTHVVQQNGAVGTAAQAKVQRMCPACDDEESRVQAKLEVSQPDDPAEVEAEVMAKQIVQALDSGSTASAPHEPPLREGCGCSAGTAEEQALQERPAPRVVTTSQLLRDTAHRGWVAPHLLREGPFAGLASAMAEAEGDTDTVPIDDEAYLYATNGVTSCALPGGTPSVSISNTECTRPCTARHEGVHATDITPCCAKAGTAFTAAANDADRMTVRRSFGAWLGANRAWFECRAYAESVRCADGYLGGSTISADCRTKMASYRANTEASRVSNCASAAASLTACPFA